MLQGKTEEDSGKTVLTMFKRRYILHKNQVGRDESPGPERRTAVRAQMTIQSAQSFGFTFFGGFYFSRFFPVSEKMPVNGNLSR